LEGVGSSWSAVTVAVFVTARPLIFGVTLIVTTTDEPEARDGNVQTTGSACPQAVDGRADTSVAWAGMWSVTTTLVAVLGPVFFTVIV
jgi:hypothetical protein